MNDIRSYVDVVKSSPQIKTETKKHKKVTQNIMKTGAATPTVGSNACNMDWKQSCQGGTIKSNPPATHICSSEVKENNFYEHVEVTHSSPPSTFSSPVKNSKRPANERPPGKDEKKVAPKRPKTEKKASIDAIQKPKTNAKRKASPTASSMNASPMKGNEQKNNEKKVINPSQKTYENTLTDARPSKKNEKQIGVTEKRPASPSPATSATASTDASPVESKKKKSTEKQPGMNEIRVTTPIPEMNKNTLVDASPVKTNETQPGSDKKRVGSDLNANEIAKKLKLDNPNATSCDFCGQIVSRVNIKRHVRKRHPNRKPEFSQTSPETHTSVQILKTESSNNLNANEENLILEMPDLLNERNFSLNLTEAETESRMNSIKMPELQEEKYISNKSGKPSSETSEPLNKCDDEALNKQIIAQHQENETEKITKQNDSEENASPCQSRPQNANITESLSDRKVGDMTDEQQDGKRGSSQQLSEPELPTDSCLLETSEILNEPAEPILINVGAESGHQGISDSRLINKVSKPEITSNQIKMLEKSQDELTKTNNNKLNSNNKSAKKTGKRVVSCRYCENKVRADKLKKHIKQFHNKKEAWSQIENSTKSKNLDTLQDIGNNQTTENRKNLSAQDDDNSAAISGQNLPTQDENEAEILSEHNTTEETVRLPQSNTNENSTALDENKAETLRDKADKHLDSEIDCSETATSKKSAIANSKDLVKLDKYRSETKKICCLHCSKHILEKSYKRHLKEIHHMEGSNLRDKSQKSIIDAFAPRKVMSECEDSSQLNAETGVEDKQNAGTDNMSWMTICHMLQNLEKRFIEYTERQDNKPKPSDEASPVLKKYKSIPLIEDMEELKDFLAGEFELKNNGFKCLVCQNKKGIYSFLTYDAHEPTRLDGKCNKKFTEIKFKIKRHCETSNHQNNVEKYKIQQEKKEIAEQRRVAVGMRLMRIVYRMTKHNEADEKFESNLLVEYKNGVDIGDINHSKTLPARLVPSIADDVKRNIRIFLQTPLEQTGYLPCGKVLFDSSTTKKVNREFVGFVCTVPDSDELIQVIYIGNGTLSETKGVDIAQVVLQVLKLGTEEIVIKEEQYLGTSVDGHTLHCNVHEYLDKELKVKIPRHHEYDYMHKAGRMDIHIRKMDNFAWLTSLTVQLGDTLTYIEDAKEYGTFLKCMEMFINDPDRSEEKAYSFARYNKVRFANSASTVYNNSYENFAVLIRTLESQVLKKSQAGEMDAARKASNIVDSINNVRFATRLCGVNDIYKVFKKISNKLQEVNVLPHERMEDFFNSVSILVEMTKCVKSHSLCPIDKKTNSKDCRWPTLHKEMENLKQGKFKGQSLGGNFAEPYPTKEGTKFIQKQKKIDQLDAGCEEVQSLAKALHEKLKDNVFPQQQKNYINDLKQITDLQMLHAEVIEKGHLRVWNETKQKIDKIAREIVPQGPDFFKTGNPLEDEYKLFLSKLEKNIKRNTSKEADSKELIKLFINSKEKLYVGIKKMIHLLCIASVGTGIESIVESHMSIFKNRLERGDLTEERANNEMMIAINGPCISEADNLLHRAMSVNPIQWHFIKGDRTRKNFKVSKVIDRKQLEKSKLPFTL